VQPENTRLYRVPITILAKLGVRIMRQIMCGLLTKLVRHLSSRDFTVVFIEMICNSNDSSGHQLAQFAPKIASAHRITLTGYEPGTL
jgi:hypothetical protein